MRQRIGLAFVVVVVECELVIRVVNLLVELARVYSSKIRKIK